MRDNRDKHEWPSVTDIGEKIGIMASQNEMVEVSHLAIGQLLSAWSETDMMNAALIFAGHTPQNRELLFTALVIASGCQYYTNPMNGNYMFYKVKDSQLKAAL